MLNERRCFARARNFCLAIVYNPQMTTESGKPLDRSAATYYLVFSTEMLFAAEAPNSRGAGGKNNPNKVVKKIAV